MPSTKEAKRKYYLKNRDHILEQSKINKIGKIPLYRRDMKSYIRYLCGKAKLRTKEFNLTYEQLYELWDKQKGLCAYTKMPLNNIANHLEAASLDRIDSTKGYVKDNIQFVCTAVNRMKQEFSENDFLRFCELITNNKNKDNLQDEPRMDTLSLVASF